MFSASGSHTILVFLYPTGWRYSDGNPLKGASNAKGSEKFTICDHYHAISRNWCKIVTVELLWKANRKPHPSFRMIPFWITLSDLLPRFQGHDIIQRQITQKRYKIELYLQRGPIESRMWSIERRRFQWPWTTPNPVFKVTLFFDAEYLINGTTYIHSLTEILTGTYTRLTQRCHFEWPWVTLTELPKYSMTRSILRSLCDNWASCFKKRHVYSFINCVTVCQFYCLHSFLISRKTFHIDLNNE